MLSSMALSRGLSARGLARSAKLLNNAAPAVSQAREFAMPMSSFKMAIANVACSSIITVYATLDLIRCIQHTFMIASTCQLS